MSDRIHPAAIDATGYVGDGAHFLADDGTWKAGGSGSGGVYPADVDKGIKYNPIDITTYKAQSDAAVRLTLPVTGSEATHPSVKHFPGGWNGYRYWMAFTPYPGGNDAYEDPYVLASQDGTTWETPAGLTNPLDDQPGSPGNLNSDTELIVSVDGLTLYCLWRTVTSTQEILYLRSSTDGVMWTPKVAILTVTIASERVLSPTIQHDGTQWVMWTVDMVPSPNVIRRRTCATLTGTWSASSVCTVTNAPAGRDLWHLAVIKLGAQYIALLNDTLSGISGDDGRLYLMRSTDGLAWTCGEEILSQDLAANYDSLYRGSLVPTFVNGRLEFDMWHGGWVSSSFYQGIYRHRLAKTPDASGITVQDENGTVATGVTQIDFQGANVTAAAGTGEVVVTVTGSSSSSGEVLMQDGVTSPPVPIETEAGDDWLYSG